MRLWSIHPSYLDTTGLVACWREGLLAQKVLAGQTNGYKDHPQLIRFRAPSGEESGSAIGRYLFFIYQEACRRGLHFDMYKIQDTNHPHIMSITQGQLVYEIKHLAGKLMVRSQDYWSRQMRPSWSDPLPHPMFYPVPGEIESWEKVK